MNVLFINSSSAKCSIHESGRMVAGCLANSDQYNFIYTTIDQFDMSELEAGNLTWNASSGREPLPQIDVIVANWHIITMPLSDHVVKALPGFKAAVVLEAAPGDPLALTPVKSFDAYLVLDPTLPESDKVFSFPRPLREAEFTPRLQMNTKVRIGSFGFSTPGKGFELVVEAVNREFDEADVRINIPRGDFIGTTDSYHDEDYIQYIERTLQTIAKPGINVTVTTDFFTPDEVVEWCDANDLNCFMYTRDQPGLSATTDQAIMSGRPLATISNPTFRHVCHYLTPYPQSSLRDAIAQSVPGVEAMKEAWSAASFRSKFESVISMRFAGHGSADEGRAHERFTKLRIAVAEIKKTSARDLIDYSSRLVAALNRSDAMSAEPLKADRILDFLANLLTSRPEVLILAGDDDALTRQWAAAARSFLPTVTVLEASREPGGESLWLPPIIPFHTTAAVLLRDSAIVMIGFSEDVGGAVRALRIIARDDALANILIDVPAAMTESLREGIGIAKAHSEVLSALRINFVDLPLEPVGLINLLGSSRAIVAQADLRAPADLESKLSLAYVTERAILISGDRPVPFLADKTPRLGDVDLRVVEKNGVASRVGTVIDYGEWAFAARFIKHLECIREVPGQKRWVSQEDIDSAAFGLLGETDSAKTHVSTDNTPAGEQRALRHLLAELGGMFDCSDATFVARLYRMVLEREPDDDGFRAHVEALQRDEPRCNQLASFLTSDERRSLADKSQYWRIYPALRLQFPCSPVMLGWIEGLLSLEDKAFADEVMRLSGALQLPVDIPQRLHEASDRVVTLFAVAQAARATFDDVSFVAARTKQWDRWARLIQGGTQGVPRDLPALPRLPAARHEDCDVLARREVFAGWDSRPFPRAATNIFDKPQHSHLYNGVDARLDEVRAVYVLVRPDKSQPDHTDTLRMAWPVAACPLREVVWSEAERQLEYVAADQSRAPVPLFADQNSAWLVMSAGMMGDEPMAEMASLFAARGRGWKVAAIVEPVPTDVASDREGTSKSTLYWRTLGLVDRIIATSPLAARQITDFLGREYPTTAHPLVEIISSFHGGDGGAMFARRMAEALNNPSERFLVGSEIFLRSADSTVGQILSEELQSLGFSVADINPDDTLPDSTDCAETWLIADGFSAISDLVELRELADAGSARSLFLGRVPPGSPGLFDELIKWDLVAVTRRADFEAFARELEKTRYHIVDAETRFVLVDHPGEWIGGDAPLDDVIDRQLRAGVVGPSGEALLEQQQCTSIVSVPLDGNAGEVVLSTKAMDIVLIGGDEAHASDIADAAARVGMPALISEAVQIARRPGVVNFPLRTAHPGKHLALGATIVHSAHELRAWLPVARASMARELAMSMARSSIRRGCGGTSHSWSKMPSRRPLLSLCISTYNRAGWLALNLRNIYAQLGGDNLNIEVLVVDNCSSDNIADICAPYAVQANFRLVKNTVNVGMLGNLCVTAQHASGQYLWIIGDDDLTRDGAIARVMTVLAEDCELDLVYLNYGYTSIPDPTVIEDPKAITECFNLLEPAGPDRRTTVAELAAYSENFYTAIYAIVFRREHGLRAYCQNVTGRPFSSLVTCVPTAQYALAQMGDCAAYWMGTPSLVVNSNVSWQAYGPLFDLEQLPRTWDLSEVAGADHALVDRRRERRLWLIEMMWRDMLASDTIGNQEFFDPMRVLMRIKHLPELDARIGTFREIYEQAYRRHEPSARRPAEQIFAAWSHVEKV